LLLLLLLLLLLPNLCLAGPALALKPSAETKRAHPSMQQCQ
jgi:hypothetical protein